MRLKLGTYSYNETFSYTSGKKVFKIHSFSEDRIWVLVSRLNGQWFYKPEWEYYQSIENIKGLEIINEELLGNTGYANSKD